MEKNGPDDLLKRITRVDPPPFLFTRIEARLANSALARVPQARLVAMACALVLLLLLNVGVLMRSPATGDPSLGEVADGMGMNATNQLYQ